MQHVRVRRDVAEALEHREREVGGWHLECEALADQPRKLSLMIECVEAGHDTAGAVSEQECRQFWKLGPGLAHQTHDVVNIVREFRHVEPLAVRLSAASKIDRENGEARRSELPGHPVVVPAVRVEARDDGKGAACASVWLPGAKEDPQTVRALERSLTCNLRNSLCHRVLLLFLTLLMSSKLFTLSIDPLPDVRRAVRQPGPDRLAAGKQPDARSIDDGGSSARWRARQTTTERVTSLWAGCGAAPNRRLTCTRKNMRCSTFCPATSLSMWTARSFACPPEISCFSPAACLTRSFSSLMKFIKLALVAPGGFFDAVNKM